jgi:hypothetical protein
VVGVAPDPLLPDDVADRIEGDVGIDRGTAAGEVDSSIPDHHKFGKNSGCPKYASTQSNMSLSSTSGNREIVLSANPSLNRASDGSQRTLDF